jgi:hypothetical protein
MGKNKKRTLDENDDEYKTANVRFKNPYHKTVDYTLTAASALSSQLKTVQETRTVAYNPPMPIVVKPPPQLPNKLDAPQPAPSEPKKTQVSATKVIISLVISHIL